MGSDGSTPDLQCRHVGMTTLNDVVRKVVGSIESAQEYLVNSFNANTVFLLFGVLAAFMLYLYYLYTYLYLWIACPLQLNPTAIEYPIPLPPVPDPIDVGC